MPTKTLKPFQSEDAQAMASIGNSLNMSEPGVGKTAVAIGLLSANGKNLILTPRKALWQFKDEITAFRPEINPIVVIGTPKQRKAIYEAVLKLEAFTLIMTYDTMKMPFDYSYLKRL